MDQVFDSPRQAAAALRRLVNRGMPDAALFALDALAHRVQKRMQVPGKPVTYPIQWDSVRQMMAFFASNGFGGGIPYRRRGRNEQGWQTETTENGTILGNTEKSARFLYGLPSGADLSPGKKQSSIHAGHWPLLRPVVDEESRRLPIEVIQRLNQVSSQ